MSVNEIFDYRNAKYQGPVHQGHRVGLGILIDDDLSFYVSHWADNKLNQTTLVYIAHGKYIYGEWKNNEPNGLNVFRSGDTVLVGQFRRGKPTNRCLVIFQKFNFVVVLEQDTNDWGIVESGYLASYQTLLRYIELINIPVPDHYFSLTKFACYISNHSHGTVRTFPCHQNNCYFGFINGLAIIFNSNNGVVTIGHHQNEKLVEFGGKFDGGAIAEEGNFENGGERITYKENRPTTKIFSIFQKLHKRSLSFCNQYFDSRVKILSDVQSLLRDKIKDMVDTNHKNTKFTALDLNDSLDYQEYDEEETDKINKIRQNLYEPKKGKRDREEVNEQKQEENLKFFKSPHPNKTPPKIQQKKEQLNIVYTDKKQSKRNQKYVQRTDEKQKQKSDTFIRRHSISKAKDSIKNESNTIQKDSEVKSKNFNKNSKYLINYEESEYSSSYKNKNVSQKKQIINDFIQQENYRVPTFKGLIQEAKEIKNTEIQRKRQNKLIEVSNIGEFTNIEMRKRELKDPSAQPSPQLVRKYQQRMLTPQQSQPNLQQHTFKRQENKTRKSKEKSIDVKNLAKPTYQNIEERRQRILKSFQQLNKTPQKYQSPYHQASIAFSQNQFDQSSFSYMPLTISNKNTKVNAREAKNNSQVYQKSITQNTVVVKQNIPTKFKQIKNENFMNRNEVQNSVITQKRKSLFVDSQPQMQMIRQTKIKPSPTKNETVQRGTQQKLSLTPTKRRNYQYVYE